MFIETLKFLSAGEPFFQKRFSGNYAAVEALYPTGRSVQFHMGHNFNWELANLGIRAYTSYPLVAVYLPQNNKLFDRLTRYIRSRNGTQLIAATNFNKELEPFRNRQHLIGIIADQNPPHPNIAYWVPVFRPPHAVFARAGESRTPRRCAHCVCHFTKKRRGYYEGHAELATLHVRDLPAGELTKQYAAY